MIEQVPSIPALTTVQCSPLTRFLADFRHKNRPLTDPGSCRVLGNIQKLPTSLPMEGPGAVSLREMPLGIDEKTEEEYASQAKLLQEFTDISIIDKAWTFRSGSGNNSQAMFFMSQMNLLANKRKKYLLSSHILKESVRSLTFQWSPFPVELLGVSTVVPSPSGLKLLVVRNGESGSPTQLEIWSPLKLQKEIHIPQSVHGPLYVDGWFEGISWSFDEALIAYVAEEPMPSKPIFDGSGYKKEGSSDKDGGSWKGQGDWEEDWGETYARKRRPALFVVNINSGGVQAVKGIPKTLSVGQVIWVPPTSKNLVFVGWPSENGPEQVARKLGMKYCYNRPCSLYVIRAPFSGPEVDKLQFNSEAEDMAAAVSITQGMSSAFFPRFSPDGKFLVFLSAKSAVDTGAHCATDSLHRLDWPSDGKSVPPIKIYDVVPVVMCPEDGCVPGLYCSSFLQQPWLSDGCTMILSSTWGSIHVILSVNVMSGKVLRISPNNSSYSWDALAVDADNILAISSSPIDPPQIKYGWYLDPKENTNANVAWEWLDISIPSPSYPEKVQSFLSSMQFSVLKIPIRDNSENLTKGAKQPFEAIFVLSKPQSPGSCNPLIVILHGGPHSVSLTSYSKSLAFLSSLGFNSLQVNYRGSLGFGEEALQSLPGKIGCQDVNDVLAAVDHVIGMGLADPTKIVVLGGSHGGFLTTHLIGQAPDRFVAAAVRNPVCNLALMVGTSDIPDWCYVEACGTEGKNSFTEAPSVEDLHLLYNKSPISHLLKVKAPVLFLLGAQDLRVPASNGLQYARALRKEGGEVKVIVFPDDVHAIDRPQSDFESVLNIGVWFKKYCG